MKARYMPLAALLGAAVAVAPAIGSSAFSPLPSSATVTALESDQWSPREVSVAPAGTVEFKNPSTIVAHGVVWSAGPETPSCSGVPIREGRRSWSGTCTFAHEGVYSYYCYVHSTFMSGRVVVGNATTTTGTTGATESGTATTGTTTRTEPSQTRSAAGTTGSPQPSEGSMPGMTMPGATTQDPSAQGPALTLTLAPQVRSRQRGTRVKFALAIQQAGSSLDATLLLRAGRAKARPLVVAHLLRSHLPSGSLSFQLAIDAAGRRALARSHRLALTLRLVLSPPGAPRLTRSVPVLLLG